MSDLATDEEVSVENRIQAIRIVADRNVRRNKLVERASGDTEDQPPNHGQHAMTSSILSLLDSSSPRLRFAVVQAIHQTLDRQAIPMMLSRIVEESDASVFYAARKALGDLATQQELADGLRQSDPAIRRACLLNLLELPKLDESVIATALRDTDRQVRTIAEDYQRIQSGDSARPSIKGPPIANLDPHDRAILATHFEGIKTIPEGTATPTIDEVLALVENSADQVRGELLFKHANGAGCSKCHGWLAGALSHGPNLSGVGSRANLRHIVQSMLEPSAVITEGFQQQAVLTEDGLIYNGILIEESGLSLTLANSSGELQTISKSSIESRKTNPVSAMPGVGSILDAQQVADVAAYLMTLKAKGKSAPSPSTTEAKVRHSPKLKLVAADHGWDIDHAGTILGQLRYSDSATKRPYIANLRSLDGRVVTRPIPVEAISELTDHADMHPGFWIGFGDLSGQDFWRNKAGGSLLNSRGHESAAKAWGKSAEWCGMHGVVNDEPLGVLAAPHPSNFRPSWWHVRDYGLMVANPFGRKAMKQGNASQIMVKPGEKLTLGISLLVHSLEAEPKRLSKEAEKLLAIP
jgi:putative heme-binding domain-containing protein